MDFKLASEQAQFGDAVGRFAEARLKTDALKRAHNPGFPFDAARLLGAQGLLGITIPAEHGGQGGSLMDAVLAIENVALACPRSADAVQAGNFGPIRTLAEYASGDQRRRFLPDLLAGRTLIALGMSEPEAGSAVTDLTTTATPDGSGFRVTGSKVFTTNSADAALFLIYVRFGPGVGGIGSVLIERGATGFALGQRTRFHSGDEWCQLYLDQCYVGPENVLLGPGGFKKQIAGFNAERIGNAARSLALGRHAFNLARDYALGRRQFGRPICEFQGIQWKFADMRMQLDAAQLLLYRAASNADRGLPSPAETSVAKAFCNRAGFEVASEAVQIMGGAGFSETGLAEYCMRRTRGWMIAGGSIEMMKNRIAEDVFERRFSQRPSRGPAND
ncbi:MAG: acyl-CoA dehydrogenase [Alphaproteobacteria bacterium]|nr:acyl-CoA dehydrogenase [Alphaproteobacteria bacterium]